jgi:predicted MFS family arabinose efflux permease
LSLAPGHLGELTRLVPFEMVDDVLESTGRVKARVRVLPARVVVYLLLAAALFADLGYTQDVPQPDSALETQAPESRAAKPRVPRGVWALAAVAMMVMLREGVAYDWSTVQLRTVVHASAATSALAYGAYATAATVGRLIADRLSARFGPVALFLSGTALAGLGMVMVVLSHQATLAIAAWAAVGLGLSGRIPQLFTAAGGLDRDAVN